MSFEKMTELTVETWERICKRLRGPGIDTKELIPPAYVAQQAGPSNRVVVPANQPGNRLLGSLKGLQIRALANILDIGFGKQSKTF